MIEPTTADQKRQAIMKEAIKLFSAKGYQSSSLAEIAENVGVSKPFIYSYFKNKLSLLEAIYDRMRVILFDAFNDSILDTDSAQVTLYNLLNVFTLTHLQFYEMSIVFLNEERHLSANLQESLQADFDSFTEMLSDILRAGAKEGVFLVEDPLISAQAIAGMARWAHRWYDPASYPTPEHISRIMTTLAVRSVLAPGYVLRV